MNANHRRHKKSIFQMRRSLLFSARNLSFTTDGGSNSRQSVQLCIFLATLAFFGCGDATHSTPKDLSPQFGEPIVHDLGARFGNEATKVLHEFEVINSTQDVIRFTKVATSCTCTSARIGTDILQPGGKTSLNVEVDLTHRRTDFIAQVSLENDRGEPWVYVLKAAVFQRLECLPTSVQLGLRSTGAEVHQTFQVLSVETGRPPSEPVVQLSPSTGLTPFSIRQTSSTVTPLPHNLLQRRTVFAVDFVAPATPGFDQNDVSIMADGRTVTLPVSWRVQEPLLATPDQIFFTVRPDVGSLERQIELRRRDGKRFEIKQIRCPMTGVEVKPVTVGEEELHLIVISVDAAQVPQLGFGAITVAINDPLLPMQTIPVAVAR